MLAFEVGALANLRKQVRSVTGSVTTTGDPDVCLGATRTALAIG
jgi:hypothetical protein